MTGDLDLYAAEEPDDPDFIIHTDAHTPPLHDEEPANREMSEAEPGEPSPEADFPVARESWLPLSQESMEKSDFTIRSKPFNPAEAMHGARLNLAKWLFLLLTGVIIGGTALVITANITKRDTQQAKDLFLNVFTAILAMVSSMVGYYYGTAGRTDKES